VREHGREERVVFDVLIEACSQAVQCVDATEPLVEGGDCLIVHGWQWLVRSNAAA
jgi:hypothetical protein